MMKWGRKKFRWNKGRCKRDPELKQRGFGLNDSIN